jgi:acetyl esterase/lipase
VLVFFHGGGWTSGYKEWMVFMAPAFTAQGVTFVSAGYRLAPTHVFPAGFDDCADAIAWVVNHIAAHGGDPDRVFVGGHSAGGHYAALLAVSAPWREARGLPARVLRGCLPVSGTYRFGADSGLAMRPRFLGPANDGQAERAAAPMAQLQPAACPPFLMSYGSRDFAHLIAQAQQMTATLRAAHVPVQVELLEECDHFEASVACGDPHRDWVARAAAWMRDMGA